MAKLSPVQRNILISVGVVVLVVCVVLAVLFAPKKQVGPPPPPPPPAPTNQQDCNSQGFVWDAATNTCDTSAPCLDSVDTD